MCRSPGALPLEHFSTPVPICTQAQNPAKPFGNPNGDLKSAIVKHCCLPMNELAKPTTLNARHDWLNVIVMGQRLLGVPTGLRRLSNTKIKNQGRGNG